MLDNGRTQLLIEYGLSHGSISKALKYDYKNIVGCLISHEHQDHCIGIAGLVKETAVDIFATGGTIKGFERVRELKGKINDYRTHEMTYNVCYSLDGWEITAFRTNHEGNEPCGFLIKTDVGERLIFATDTNFIEYRFNDLTHIMIEANYQEEILLTSDYLPSVKERIRDSHMEINQAINFIKTSQQRTSRLQEIIIIHTSSTNGNPEQFKSMIERETGVITRIANKERMI